MASKIKVDQLEGSTGSTITIPTGQTFTVTDGIPVASGGTGLASFAAGDILYATGETTLTKLTKGTAEQVLAMNSGATAPDWGSVDLTVLPTITVAKGGTNIASFTEGDILYATGATTLAKLAKGTASQTLKMNSGATAPEWTTVAAATSDFVKIATTTLSSDTQYIEFQNCFSATYDRYMLIGDNIKTDQQEMRAYMMTATNTNDDQAAYHNIGSGAYKLWYSGTTMDFDKYSDTDLTYTRFSAGWNVGNSGAKAGSLIMWINNPNSDSKPTGGHNKLSGYAHISGSEFYRWHFDSAWTLNENTQHTGIELFLNTGDYKTGSSFSVYGIKS